MKGIRRNEVCRVDAKGEGEPVKFLESWATKEREDKRQATAREGDGGVSGGDGGKP